MKGKGKSSHSAPAEMARTSCRSAWIALLCLPILGIAATPQPTLQLLVAGTAKKLGVISRGGSTQTSPPEKALGILRRCGASRYGRPSPREATEALVRVLDAFEAAPRVLDVGNSVIVPSTDDIALKMEERQEIDLCRSNDWSQFLRGGGLAAGLLRIRGGARRGAALPELPDAVAAAGERGLVSGPQREADVRRRRDLSAERPFLLGLLRVRTWGRYRYMAAGGGAPACTMVAPERVGLRLLGVPLRRGTSGPGARRPVLPSSRRTWCFADETLSASRAPPTAYGVWLRVG